MTDYVLGLIPDYGLYVVFAVVLLACLAVPLPASVLVLAAGGFAAAGDIDVISVFITALAAFVLGDQLAYHIAKHVGPALLGRLRANAKMNRLILRSDAMLERRGATAVLLSHTLLSPTGPYVCYLCGASGVPWQIFSGMAVLGAVIWTSAYVALGYVFAGQLAQVSEILGNFFGLILAGCAVVASGFWLRQQWRRAHPHNHKSD